MALIKRLFPYALVALAALVFWPGLHGGFLFDDFGNIVNNPGIDIASVTWKSLKLAAFSLVDGYPRPIALASFGINHALAGMDPYWMKVTNVAIHAANGMLLYALLRRVSAQVAAERGALSQFACAAIAAAWVLHPLQVSSVLYIVQRMELLGCTSVLVALLLYLRGRRLQLAGKAGWHWLALAALACFAGLGAKETALLFPLYAFVLEWAVLRFQAVSPRTRRFLVAGYAVAALAAIAVFAFWLFPHNATAAAYADRNYDWQQRLLTQGRILSTYLSWYVWPIPGRMVFYYDNLVASTGLLHPATTLLGWLLVAAMTVSAVVWRRRAPLFALGIGWFFAAHVLTSNIVPLELAFEHRNYFSLAAILLALATPMALVGRRFSAPIVGRVIAGVLLAMLAGLTTIRAMTWGNADRLTFALESLNPDSPRATYGLARQFILMSHFDRASPFNDMAMQEFAHSAGLPTASVAPDLAILLSAGRSHRPIEDAWWRNVDTKLAARPLDSQSFTVLSDLVECRIALQCDFPTQHLVDAFLATLSRGNPTPDVLSLYGRTALMLLGDAALSERMYREAYTVSHHQPLHALRLADLMRILGRDAEAEALVREVEVADRLGIYKPSIAKVRSEPHGVRVAVPAPPEAAPAPPPASTQVTP